MEGKEDWIERLLSDRNVMKALKNESERTGSGGGRMERNTTEVEHNLGAERIC